MKYSHSTEVLFVECQIAERMSIFACCRMRIQSSSHL